MVILLLVFSFVRKNGSRCQ